MDIHRKSAWTCLKEATIDAVKPNYSNVLYYMMFATMIILAVTTVIPVNRSFRCVISLIGFIPASWISFRFYARDGLRDQCMDYSPRALAFYKLRDDDLITLKCMTAGSVLVWIALWFTVIRWMDPSDPVFYHSLVAYLILQLAVMGVSMLGYGVGRMSGRRQEAEYQNTLEERRVRGREDLVNCSLPLT